MSAYGNPFQSEWGNVLLVTNLTSGLKGNAHVWNSTLLVPMEHVPNSGSARDLTWLCGDFIGAGGGCDLTKALKHSDHWTLNMLTEGEAIDYNGTWGYDPEYMMAYWAPVKYCLAQRREVPCSARISPPLLGVVVACNVVKLICVTIVLLRIRSFHPLATIGDAIASFLHEPEDITAGLGTISNHDLTALSGKVYERVHGELDELSGRPNLRFRRNINGSSPESRMTTWKAERRRWSAGAGGIRGFVAFIV